MSDDSTVPVQQPQAPPDPLAELVLLVGDPEVDAEIRALSDPAFSELCARAVAQARAAPDAQWLVRLRALRLLALDRNARVVLPMVLSARADVADVLGLDSEALDTLQTLVDVQELLGKGFDAHTTMLRLARAQADAGQADAAEATLHRSLEHAKTLAPAGQRVPASGCMSRSLVHLGQLYALQGQQEQAELWLAGAVDIALDPADRTAAEAALAVVRGSA